MAHLKTFLLDLVRDEEGATMVEYALMVALIAIVCIVTVGLLGGKANATFDSATKAMPTQ